jgi:hypothetical protein
VNIGNDTGIPEMEQGVIHHKAVVGRGVEDVEVHVS